MEYAWNRYGICMEYVWNMHGICIWIGYVWNLPLKLAEALGPKLPEVLAAQNWASRLSGFAAREWNMHGIGME